MVGDVLPLLAKTLWQMEKIKRAQAAQAVEAKEPT